MKSFAGFNAHFFGGNLLSKLYYNDVLSSSEMYNKIKSEGIVHFTSSETVDKIMNSDDNYIKSSNLLLSGGKKKSYFFAGIPSFKDLTVNVYSNNVMCGVRIIPTEEQIEELVYREYNDKAVAYEGNFHFKKEQAQKVYCGLKADEFGNLYYDEITEEEALNYHIDENVKKIYNGNNSYSHKMMCNALRFYYEYENYRLLLKRLKKKSY